MSNSLKRTAQEAAVSTKKVKLSPAANFFTPRSQQAAMPDKMTKLPSPPSLQHWLYQEPGPSNYMKLSAPKPAKLALYDLDGTLIKTKSGRRFPAGETDWVWWDISVKRKLLECHNDGYQIIIISNQNYKAGSKPLVAWQQKIRLIAQDLPNPDIPMRFLAANDKDEYRKPRIGMYEVVKRLCEAQGCEIDITKSFYVGDAAGRSNDHADTDIKWALNCGLRFFTPEEHFKNSPALPHQLSGFNPAKWVEETKYKPLVSPTTSPIIATDTNEVVIFVGYPASGKTSFYKRYFEKEGYIHCNQDTLKSREACVALVKQSLEKGTGVVVDNTNRTVATRRIYVDIARQMGVAVRCFYFDVSLDHAQHNNLHRAYHANPSPGTPRRALLPLHALESFKRELQVPTKEEGFPVLSVNWKLEGTEDEKRRWLMWTL